MPIKVKCYQNVTAFNERGTVALLHTFVSGVAGYGALGHLVTLSTCRRYVINVRVPRLSTILFLVHFGLNLRANCPSRPIV